jgi:hypothetical protein
LINAIGEQSCPANHTLHRSGTPFRHSSP